MVAAVLSIRVSLLRNTYVRHRFSAFIAAALALGLITLTVALCILLPAQLTETQQRADYAVLGGASIILMWSLTPVLLAGVDRSLSIDSLRLFPLRRGEVMIGLGMASLIGSGGLALCCALAVLVASVTTEWAVLPISTGVGLLSIVLAVLARQLLLDALSLLTAARRRREVFGIIVLVAVVLCISAVLLISSSGWLASWFSVDQLVSLLVWTPFGAPWAIPGAMVAGRTAEATAYAGITLFSLLVMSAVWGMLVTRRLRPAPSRGRPIGRYGLSVLRVVPDSVLGAVAARTLINWIRDPRYSTMWAFALALPVLGAVMSIIGGTYWLLMIYPLFSLFLVATTGALDISNDGKSHAVHISVSVGGFHDALGRTLGHTLAASPFIALSIGLGFRVMSPLEAIGYAGVTIAVAGGTLGAARATTARILVPVASGDRDATETRPGSGFPTFLHYGVSAITACASSAVPTVLAVLATATGVWQLAVGALVVGIVCGAGAAWLGVGIGARILDRSPHQTYAGILRVS